jgi:DNA repair photolyase
MKILTEFDPWKNKLCTCPFKYSFSPYVGCSHKCLYCYASSYIPKFFNPRVKKNVIERLKKDVKKIKENKYVSISNSSDPYQHLEKKLEITRRCLKIFSQNNFKIMIITKSDLVIRDIDVLKNLKAAVSITITTLDKEKSKKLEPGAPSPEKRLNALKILNENNIPTIARIDPIIPNINDYEIEELVKNVAEVGVKHIVSSTYKVKIDNWKRMEREFPKEMEELKSLYFLKGEKINGYYYLPKNIRFEIMKRIAKEVKKYNLTFAVCREGFLNLNTSKTCDGSHLIK